MIASSSASSFSLCLGSNAAMGCPFEEAIILSNAAYLRSRIWFHTCKSLSMALARGCGGAMIWPWLLDATIPLTYTQVSAGCSRVMFRRSDHLAVACGGSNFLKCGIPALDDQLTCTQIGACGSHTMLWRSYCSVLAGGCNFFFECRIAALLTR